VTPRRLAVLAERVERSLARQVAADTVPRVALQHNCEYRGPTPQRTGSVLGVATRVGSRTVNSSTGHSAGNTGIAESKVLFDDREACSAMGEDGRKESFSSSVHCGDSQGRAGRCGEETFTDIDVASMLAGTEGGSMVELQEQEENLH